MRTASSSAIARTLDRSGCDSTKVPWFREFCPECSSPSTHSYRPAATASRPWAAIITSGQWNRPDNHGTGGAANRSATAAAMSAVATPCPATPSGTARISAQARRSSARSSATSAATASAVHRGQNA